MLKTIGNIDILNRPIVENEDGSISTTLSFSVNIEGAEVLLPMIVNGVKLTQDDAILHYRTTGEHLGIFDTPVAADRYAKALHDFQVFVLCERGILLESDPQLSSLARMRCADETVSNLHDLIYNDPFDREAANEAIWKVHDLLRKA